MERRNIIKSQNALGKYNDMWYNIIPYGLGTIYFLHGDQNKVVTKRDFGIATG